MIEEYDWLPMLVTLIGAIIVIKGRGSDSKEKVRLSTWIGIILMLVGGALVIWINCFK